MPLPSSIDGVTGFENNAELNFMEVDGPNNDGGVIRPDEVKCAIDTLVVSKGWGLGQNNSNKSKVYKPQNLSFLDC